MGSSECEPAASFATNLTPIFRTPANRAAMESALARVRTQLGQHYSLLIAGERFEHAGKADRPIPRAPMKSSASIRKPRRNWPIAPWKPHTQISRNGAARQPQQAIRMLIRTAALLRERKLEFDAWLVLEAGKTWPEAEAETAEAIDFCEYYAREMERLGGPQPVGADARRTRRIPLPAAWRRHRNSALEFLAGDSGCGMAVAALVTGNTVVIKPSSETPTSRRKFAEVLLEAGFPAESFSLPHRQRTEPSATFWSQHPRTRFVSFTGSRDVGLHINELAAKPANRPDLDQAHRRRDGRQGRDHRGCRLRSRRRGGRRGGFGLRLSGTEMFGVFARHRA